MTRRSALTATQRAVLMRALEIAADQYAQDEESPHQMDSKTRVGFRYKCREVLALADAFDAAHLIVLETLEADA